MDGLGRVRVCHTVLPLGGASSQGAVALLQGLPESTGTRQCRANKSRLIKIHAAGFQMSGDTFESNKIIHSLQNSHL